jgi:hypothetical protein
VVIVNGVRIWWRNGTERPHRHTAHREAGVLSYADRHFRRHFIRQLLQSLDLEEIGSIQTAGHECIRIRATPSESCPQLWSHWFPLGADKYELHVDPERAALLAIIARVGEAVFETNEVVEVTYDQPLDNKLFTIPPGDKIPTISRARGKRRKPAERKSPG